MSDAPSPEPTVQLENEVLDIQHDPFPAEDHGLARRIPHLGHALLFLGLTATVFFFCLLVVYAGLHGHVTAGSNAEAVASLLLEGVSYVLTLVAAVYVFPPLWKRSFLRGIHWNGLTARRYWPRLMVVGVLLSVLAQLAERFVPEPKDPAIEHLMRSPAGAWTAMLMGTFLAPVFEEIAFRGFLLPALATAYDWLSLDRTPAGLQRWTTTTSHSRPALLFGALVSSIPFALLHAPQLQYSWGPVAVILGVGLVLAAVRVRTHSVACSTLVHLTYNLTIFVAALVASGGFRHLDRL
jgi:membrane protease YdiL (CAAX protease family)